MKKLLVVCFSIWISCNVYCKAQSNLSIQQLFPEIRIANGHSVETLNEGILKFSIMHRFSSIEGGFYDLFGLDDGLMRLGFDYGIKDYLNIGIGRSSTINDYDAYIKLKLVNQKRNSFPMTSSLFFSTVYDFTEYNEDFTPVNSANRYTYIGQLLLARKFGSVYTLQLMPTYLIRNLYSKNKEEDHVQSIGLGQRIRVTKSVSVNMEYYYVMSGQLSTVNTNSFSVGFDFEKKGHVFQLMIGNSTGLNESQFITQTTGSWEDGELHIGFNLTRDFKLKGRNYRSAITE